MPAIRARFSPKVQRQSEELAHPISERAASIQFQDITRQQLGHLGDSPEGVAVHFQETAMALLRGVELPEMRRAHRIDRMSSGYVMQQRDRHAGSEEAATQAIQLF